MADVKLGKFTMADYAAEKPVGIGSTGELIYPKDLLKKKSAPMMFSAAMAAPDNRIKLALARLDLEPDFEIVIFGSDFKYTKDDLIKHIKDQTSMGMQFMDMEVNYSSHFSQQLMGTLPILKSMPVIKPVNTKPEVPANLQGLPPSQLGIFKARVLFCENTTDPIIAPAANYRIQNVHPVFVKRGFEVIALIGSNAIQKNFQSKATDIRVCYIGGTGHGSYTTFTGDQQSVVLKVGGYKPGVVRKEVIHFLSCQTARTLGPDTVKKGAYAYVGYDESYVVDLGSPELYYACDSQFDISMANGRTVEQAVADTNAKYDVTISSVPGTSTAAFLLSNKNLIRSPVSGPSWGKKDTTLKLHVF